MLRGRSFDDKTILATAVWSAVGYALYATWPWTARSALLAWVAVPLLFQWAIAWVLWRRDLRWATLEGLARTLYVVVFIALWVFTPILTLTGGRTAAGPLLSGIVSLAYLALAELVVSRLLGERARQERVEQRDKWRMLHRLPFLDVLFVRLPRL